MRILFLDIETSPNSGYFWGLWEQNIAPSQLLETSNVLCWSAKWYGSKEILFDSVHKSSEINMLKGVHKLLSEADAVVHFNGTKFDIPTLNKEFVLNNLLPPPPSKQIDLLKVCRGQFRFPSNRLDYVASALGLGEKKKTEFKLWVDCMNNDAKAWREMERYNKHDVKLLELVYIRLLPWIKSHANYNLYGQTHSCPNCGSKQVQNRGITVTKTLRYQRFQCQDCGTWSRSAVRDKSSPKPLDKLVGI